MNIRFQCIPFFISSVAGEIGFYRNIRMRSADQPSCCTALVTALIFMKCRSAFITTFWVCSTTNLLSRASLPIDRITGVHIYWTALNCFSTTAILRVGNKVFFPLSVTRKYLFYRTLKNFGEHSLNFGPPYQTITTLVYSPDISPCLRCWRNFMQYSWKLWKKPSTKRIQIFKIIWWIHNQESWDIDLQEL